MAIERDRWEHKDSVHVAWLSDNICVEVFQVGARNNMMCHCSWVTQWCWFEPKEKPALITWAVELGHHANKDKACKEVLFKMVSPTLGHALALVIDDPSVPTREELRHSHKEFQEEIELLTTGEFGAMYNPTIPYLD